MDKKIKQNKNLINNKLIYSPIKQKAKGLPPNSVLKPETSSDSPSEKSKGVRFLSAKKEGTNKINTGSKLIALTILILVQHNSLKLNHKKQILMKQKAEDTS